MLFTRPADKFFNTRIERMLDHVPSILDIGGGLRIDRERSNRVDPQHAWIRSRMEEKGVAYRVLDYVDTYHPDIVGDIQDLPLADGSEHAIVCLSVLEHVEDPFKASREIHRVLKKGGVCLLYVPFLFYYHAERGYYGDYWRFTEDSLRLLFKNFTIFEIHNTRGPLETLIRLSPLGRTQFFCDMGYVLDRATGKLSSKQTSGYNVFLTK